MKKLFGIVIFLVIVVGFFFAFRGQEKVTRVVVRSSEWSEPEVCYNFINNAGQKVLFCDDELNGSLDHVAIVRSTWFGLGSDKKDFIFLLRKERSSGDSNWDFVGEFYNYPAILLTPEDRGYSDLRQRYRELREDYKKLHPEAASFPENQ